MLSHASADHNGCVVAEEKEDGEEGGEEQCSSNEAEADRDADQVELGGK